MFAASSLLQLYSKSNTGGVLVKPTGSPCLTVFPTALGGRHSVLYRAAYAVKSLRAHLLSNLCVCWASSSASATP